MVVVLNRGLVAAAAFLASLTPALAVTDEIQVYNAEIAEVGQWTFQLHSNYAFVGRTEPDFPGGIVPNHALNGTGEWAYGITQWWELGLYTPFAVDQNGTFYSNGAKIRQLFVVPHAQEREFFYGINFELGYALPQFSETKWNVEIRPIVGWRKGDYEFIVNPIIDVGIGQAGQVTFAPAARFARKLNDMLTLGVEYYTDLGPLQNFLPFNEQQHNIYAVVDFKVGRFDVNAGIGYGLTPGSDRLMGKVIIGTELNKGDAEQSGKSLRKVVGSRPASLKD
ncbi:MAG: hypothetical protein ACJ72H_19535 [Candidatus Sulfotelmatobacter sp.]